VILFTGAHLIRGIVANTLGASSDLFRCTKALDEGSKHDCIYCLTPHPSLKDLASTQIPRSTQPMRPPQSITRPNVRMEGNITLIFATLQLIKEDYSQVAIIVLGFSNTRKKAVDDNKLTMDDG
jgi:hypothetical protein